jgi:acetyltransferase-like isoleucine patch superfamily enzyme
VTVGNKVVILPMSVITTDIPDYSIVAGSPAKVIRTLTEEEIQNEIKKVLK